MLGIIPRENTVFEDSNPVGMAFWGAYVASLVKVLMVLEVGNSWELSLARDGVEG